LDSILGSYMAWSTPRCRAASWLSRSRRKGRLGEGAWCGILPKGSLLTLELGVEPFLLTTVHLGLWFFCKDLSGGQESPGLGSKVVGDREF
jgi:hypothetical protein